MLNAFSLKSSSKERRWQKLRMVTPWATQFVTLSVEPSVVI